MLLRTESAGGLHLGMKNGGPTHRQSFARADRLAFVWTIIGLVKALSSLSKSTCLDCVAERFAKANSPYRNQETDPTSKHL